VHYTEWGDPDNDSVLICVHGLTRNSRDFDLLATVLQQDYRVVCPDLPGRGLSEWLPDKADYQYSHYLQAMAVLLARLRVEQVEWLGTSLGGVIGLLLAGQPNTPIRRLLLNDVGPFISKAALARIGAYVGKAPRFKDLHHLEAYVRTVYAGFGELTDAQWGHLAFHSGKRLPNGEYALHYDPAIGEMFRKQVSHPVDLWKTWDAICCPVRVLRGEHSDVLTRETMAEMQVRGPKAEVIEFRRCGHAPALMATEQIMAVRDWFVGRRTR
jgi:pimeloyl-ACP methyl ester carboxylesterase